MRITMKQIAELAGVHRSTVDKVIHNRPGISEPVKERVRAIIEEYGYQPNTAGVALRMQEKTFRVAVILMDVDSTDYNLSGLDRGFAEFEGYDIRVDWRVIPASTARKMADVLGEIERNRSADGVILMPHWSDSLKEAVNRLKQLDIPTVLMNGDLPECGYLCYIGADNRRASRVAARLMGICLGGRGKIALITSAIVSENNNASVEIRERFFQDFIRTRFPDIEIVETVENFESSEITYQETLRLLRDYPDLRGIYNPSGGAARVGDAVEAMGRSGGVTVITHELYPEILEKIQNGTILCTIGSELVNQGFLAAKVLMDYLIFKKEPESRTIYTKSEIILKENAENTEP